MELTRRFYLLYPQVGTAIPLSVTTELGGTVHGPDSVVTDYGIRQPAVGESALAPIPQPLVAEFKTRKALPKTSPQNLPTPFATETVLRFSWTHLVELVRIEDAWKRAFFENECLKGNWSVRQLQRQIESLLYERTGLSKNKKALVERARTAGVKETVEDLIRDPYVLEFIGLAEREGKG